MNDRPDTKQIVQDLERDLAAMLTSGEYRAFLDMLSTFHRYSISNVMWLYAQQRQRNMSASQFAGFNTWKKLGRFVCKGEKGFCVLAPLKTIITDADTGDKRVIVRGFRIEYVFDISQTDGKELPDVGYVETELGMLRADHCQIEAAIVQLAESIGVTVESGNTGAAWAHYDYGRKAIVMDNERNEQDSVFRLQTLLHEYAHAHADHRDRTKLEDKETVAESVAYVVMAGLGYDVSKFALPYLAGWAGDIAVMRRNMSEVQQIAHAILEGVTA